MKKAYTLGEVFRLGLLKNHEGNPYTSKAAISRVAAKLKTFRKMTPFGLGVFIPSSEIAKHNKKQKGLL